MYSQLKVDTTQSTLVDAVETSIINFIKSNKLGIGDCLPSEHVLSENLGVARSVLREALSRLKMLGLIESRSRRGMVITEPSIFFPMKKIIKLNLLSTQPTMDILSLRIALELGMVNDIFSKLTDSDIDELSRIVNVGIVLEDNEYENMSEYNFHSKLYRITGNQAFIMFQDIIQPVIEYIKSNFTLSFKPINKRLKEEGLIVTHSDLLELIKKRDKEGFGKALENHFLPYRIFLKENSNA